MMLPETLHHKLPNTLEESKRFGKDQVIIFIFIKGIYILTNNFCLVKMFWSLPKKPIAETELETLEKLNPQE